MGLHSGNGGSVVVGDTTTTLNVGKWSITKNPSLADATHSGTAGWKKRKATVKDIAFTIELPWDDTTMPDVDASMDQGDEIASITLNVGGSGKAYTGPGIVDTYTLDVDSKGDIVRATVTGFSNGAWTDPTT